MNTELRNSYRCNMWSQKETFLSYLGQRGAFATMCNANKMANPYWYNAIYDYSVGERELFILLKNKSIKKSRLLEILDDCEQDLNSPIVRLVGMHLKTKMENI